MGMPRIILRPTPMIRKQAGFMRKLLGLYNRHKAKAPSQPPIVMTEGKPQFLTKTEGVDRTSITRRQIVLNRHFTEIISDVLANNLKKQLNEIGVSVTSIETKAWNKGVRIFYSTSKPFDSNIHDNLNSLISKLRSAISERRLIGQTPMINFVYDRNAEIDQTLQEALSQIKLKPEEERSDVANTFANPLTAAKTPAKEQHGLSAQQFSAPNDMTNNMLGFDYTRFYNQIACKLERGRGESARMLSNVSLLSKEPLLKVPESPLEEDNDPRQRVLNMQKFIVNQRKKTEYMAKLRRKKELLARDHFKWDCPEGEGEAPLD